VVISPTALPGAQLASTDVYSVIRDAVLR
jgi:hypothetical protein